MVSSSLVAQYARRDALRLSLDAALLDRNAVDALSDVLKSVHLQGAVYLRGEFTAPWCIRGECGLQSVRERLAGAEHVAFFHFLTEGSCKFRLVDGSRVQHARAGDLILFPKEGKHLMGSDLQLAPQERDAVVEPFAGADPEIFHMRYGGGGEATRFICGYLALSRSAFRPLFETLPPMMCVHMSDGAAAGMLHELFRAGVRESLAQDPGASSTLAKVAELLFVEAMRRYMEQLPPGGKGWLAAARDPQVGRALALLHGNASRAWTVDELAKEVALSRSALADRFTSMVGEPPMQYLTRWRLALAAQTLREGREPISRIAEKSGYESEAAFSRAFKREFGVPPAGWRKSA
jgi:AraC-like DNA-binding protein